jgi:hexosaminidase
VAQCKARCLSTSGCGGFNFPHGVLKKTDCLAHKKPEGAVDLYVLEEKPQPPPSHAPWGVVWPVPRVSDWRHAAGPPLAVATTFGINVAASPASDQSARLTRAVQRYTDMIQQASRASPKVPHLVAPVTTLTLHVDSWDEALTSHTNASYTLTVTSAGAVVTAPTIYGAMYGMETFSQLPSLGSNLINATHITIADWPTYHHR